MAGKSNAKKKTTNARKEKTLSSTETKSVMDTIGKVSSNQKEIAIKTTGALSDNSKDYKDFLTSQIEKIEEQIASTDDLEERKRLEKICNHFMLKLEKETDRNREDIKEVYEKERQFNIGATWVSIAVVSGVALSFTKVGKHVGPMLIKQVPQISRIATIFH